MFSVCFWGVRGSVACPGSDTVVYGGNTSCLEIRADGRLIIVDLGTGVRSLGNRLLKQAGKTGPVNADVFITHTHWDHIMGFPVFGPLFVPSTKLRIRGPGNERKVPLQKVLGNQLSYDYWPVRLKELAADVSYAQIGETAIDLGGGLSVTSKALNHSIATLGYRFEYQGKSIVTSYDHEPYGGASGGAESRKIRGQQEKYLEFIRGADILIYDCMYTGKEYTGSKIGWGHSTFEEGITSARQAGVKKLVCFHHDPARTDRQLDVLGRRYSALAAKPAKKDADPAEYPVNLVIAREEAVLRA